MKNEGEIINSTIHEIYKNFSNKDIFDKCTYIMPSRDRLVEFLKKLRCIIFPGYFGDNFLCNYIDNAEELLREIVNILEEQLTIAYTFDNNNSKEKIKDKVDDIIQMFIEEIPNLQKLLYLDVDAIYQGDPAAESKAIVISSYPGMLAIYVYRIAHIFYNFKVPIISRMISEYAHSRTGIDINAGAKIGKSFFIDHGTGIVIGETTIIGDNVKLYQGVTLGALSTKRGQKLAGTKRHPTIGNNVTIYSGATILGGETLIGDGCVIGGNTFITSSIAPNTKVTQGNRNE